MGDTFGNLDASVQIIEFIEPTAAPVKHKRGNKGAVDSELAQILLRFPLFDIGFYTANFPDTDFHGINPVGHYFETPLEMRGSPHPLFDRSFYRANHSNLPADRDEFLDYLEIGDREGRGPHILFDPVYYRESN